MSVNGSTKITAEFGRSVDDAVHGNFSYGTLNSSDAYTEIPWSEGTGTDQFNEAILYKSAGLTGTDSHVLSSFADHGRTIAFAEIREIWIRNDSTAALPVELTIGGGANALGVLASATIPVKAGCVHVLTFRNSGDAPVVAGTGDILTISVPSGTCPYSIQIKGVV